MHRPLHRKQTHTHLSASVRGDQVLNSVWNQKSSYIPSCCNGIERRPRQPGTNTIHDLRSGALIKTLNPRDARYTMAKWSSTDHKNVEGSSNAASRQRCLLCKPVRHPPAHRCHVIRDFPSSVSRERVGTAVAAVRSSGETKRGGRSTHHGGLIRQSPYLVDSHHLLTHAGRFLLLGEMPLSSSSSFHGPICDLFHLAEPNRRLHQEGDGCKPELLLLLLLLKRSALSRILLCAFATVTHNTRGNSHCCAAVRRTAEQSSLEASDRTKSHCGGLG